jgi:class 3 adenylate cyclase
MKLNTAKSHTERALAAIVLTDAVSFSARMSVDEEGTLALIQRDLELIGTLCDRYGGQVLKSTGDGLLMSFYSAVQAVLCSQEIQRELAKLSEGLPPEDYLQHRIGIHLGDVLFSHDDVLGNGVNIAARLQTQSTPGGICISQTVYDVVKARVDIRATFLGSLKLKNIQEPVPAFQIPPVGHAVTMVVPQSPTSSPLAHPPALANAAQTLESHPQGRRIKKLVFGTYQGVWENDPKVLIQFDLASLLAKLYQRHHTLISLEKALQLTAARLNHKEAYLEVTHVILTALEPVYDQQEDTSTCTGKAELAAVRNRYRKIAQRLSQQSDFLRIKKLLYAIIHTTWENDPAKLALQAMVDLVADVHQVAPTEADLSYHLERIIKRLNRQSHYMPLALVISETFYPLYGAESGTKTEMAESTAMAPSEDPQTVMMTSDDTVFPEDGVTSATRLDSLNGAVEQTIVDAKTPSPAALDSSASSPTKLRDRANLFNLRLEVMRYTNPLRAKILLLSTVRSPFTATSQDWLTLKAKTLDDLIQETFDYCQTFADLESKLTIMCHCVDSVVENLQTAGVILQAMKPFYPSSD